MSDPTTAETPTSKAMRKLQRLGQEIDAETPTMAEAIGDIWMDMDGGSKEKQLRDILEDGGCDGDALEKLLRRISRILNDTPTIRYGFYVNGDLWAECSDENHAELIMDACAATFSPAASFDVMPLNETKD